MPDEPDPPRKFYKLKAPEFDRVNVPTNTPDASEIHAVLRENLDRANAAGLNEVIERPRRVSRRKRDYWILFFLGNGFFGGALAYFGLSSIPGMFGFGGMVFFTCALTFVMWFVMDEY